MKRFTGDISTWFRFIDCTPSIFRGPSPLRISRFDAVTTTCLFHALPLQIISCGSYKLYRNWISTNEQNARAFKTIFNFSHQHRLDLCTFYCKVRVSSQNKRSSGRCSQTGTALFGNYTHTMFSFTFSSW